MHVACICIHGNFGESEDNFGKLVLSFHCEFLGQNSGIQDWWQLILPSEPFPWPGNFLPWEQSFQLKGFMSILKDVAAISGMFWLPGECLRSLSKGMLPSVYGHSYLSLQAHLSVLKQVKVRWSWPLQCWGYIRVSIAVISQWWAPWSQLGEEVFLFFILQPSGFPPSLRKWWPELRDHGGTLFTGLLVPHGLLN